jgi:hypothetical protein
LKSHNAGLAMELLFLTPSANYREDKYLIWREKTHTTGNASCIANIFPQKKFQCD